MGRKSRTKKLRPPTSNRADRREKTAFEPSTHADGAVALFAGSFNNKSRLVAAPRFQKPYITASICGLIVLAIALVFGKTVQFDFVNYDDNLLVYDNPMVKHGLTANGFVWAFTTKGANMWYPLTWLSYMLDTQIYGLKPGAII